MILKKIKTLISKTKHFGETTTTEPPRRRTYRFFQYQIEKEIQNNRETTINESLSSPETINNLQRMKLKVDGAHNRRRRKIMQRNKKSMYGIGIGRYRLALNVSYCPIRGERERDMNDSYTNFSDELTTIIRLFTHDVGSPLLYLIWI